VFGNQSNVIASQSIVGNGDTSYRCVLDGHGLYLFLYNPFASSLIKYQAQGVAPFVQQLNVMPITTKHITQIMYNSLGNGYLFSPSTDTPASIVPMNFFRGKSGEENRTLLPNSEFTYAAIDIYNGFGGGTGDSNIWVGGKRSGSNKFIAAVYHCISSASIPSPPTLIQMLSTPIDLSSRFSIDYVSRLLYTSSFDSPSGPKLIR
jgi:hypothetical protein